MWLIVKYKRDLHVIDLLYDVQHYLGIVLKIIQPTLMAFGSSSTLNDFFKITWRVTCPYPIFSCNNLCNFEKKILRCRVGYG